MSSNSTLGKMLDSVLPPMPAFLEMVTEQADVLAQSLSLAVECLSESNIDKMQQLTAVETKAKELRQKHLDKLHDSFSTPIDRVDLLQAIQTLATPVESMRLVLEEMHALKILSDNFCLEMAVVLRESATALHRGYSKLSTTPGLADPDAQVALQCLSSVDRVYRKALGKLFTIDSDVKDMKDKVADAEINAFIHVVDILKRREAYRHFRNIASKMGEAGAVLHSIVVQNG
ncbi:MAG: hypothetical protein H7839_00130 [Magnetococcus sp. YQC-5]